MADAAPDHDPSDHDPSDHDASDQHASDHDASAHDGVAVRLPPPLVPLFAIGLGAAADAWLMPFEVAGDSDLIRYGLGGVLLAMGLGLLAVAGGQFRGTGQHPAPWKPTPAIVSSGIYRFTRNPMYLGMGILQAGIGLMMQNGWIVASVPLTWLVIWGTAIRHEEAYLERKFGDDYLRYKATVRRWL